MYQDVFDSWCMFNTGFACDFCGLDVFFSSSWIHANIPSTIIQAYHIQPSTKPCPKNNLNMSHANLIHHSYQPP